MPAELVQESRLILSEDIFGYPINVSANLVESRAQVLRALLIELDLEGVERRAEASFEDVRKRRGCAFSTTRLVQACRVAVTMR